MKQEKPFTLPGVKGRVRIQRLENGHPQITADDELDLFYGLGYMHAADRQAQMWLTKIVGNGQGSQYLDSGPLMIETDKYMRWIDLADRLVESLFQRFAGPEGDPAR